MVNYLFCSLLILNLNLVIGGDTNSQLFPPGSLGLNQVSEFNVTGPLNSFVEQIQANSQPQPQPQPQSQPQVFTQVQQPQMAQQNQQIPMIQIPTSAGGIYPQAQAQIPQIPILQQQPQPIIIGPPNRPSIDPALQQLLNSFNAVPAEAQRNTFIQAGSVPGDINTPVVSYITCYVGCSHVTNIVTNSAIKTVDLNPMIPTIALIISVIILLF